VSWLRPRLTSETVDLVTYREQTRLHQQDFSSWAQ